MIARFSAAIVAVLVLAGMAGASAGELQGPVTLAQSVTIDDDVVRLGDLFHNVGPKKAKIAVAYAPRYGGRVILDANWLSRVARSHRLRWRSSSRFDRVVVKRASQKIDREQIESAVHNALVRRANGDKLKVELDNRALALFLPPDAAPTILVKDVRVNDRNGRFSALVVAPADNPIAERTVHGKVFAVVEIPVLGRRLGRGEVISSNDIEWIEIAARRIQRDVITEARQLEGMSPRRFIRPRAPVRVGDVRRPILVTKGSAVTIVLRTPLMILTVRGRAAENGSKGDVIRVLNTQSKIIVDAVVVNGSTVLIREFGSLAAN